MNSTLLPVAGIAHVTWVLLPGSVLFGLIIGSFLNVVILRYEKGEGLGGRSYCPHCKKVLQWYELLPLVSWLAQRGRCTGCRAAISVQYPLVELATGVLFGLVALTWIHHLPVGSSTANLWNLFLLVSDLMIWALLAVITVYDLNTKLIPDRFSYLFAALGLVLTVLNYVLGSDHSTQHMLTVLLAGPVLFLPFFGLWKVSRGRWMGLGDGKLALGIGWYLGLSGGAAAVLLAFWIGAAVSLLLIGIDHISSQVSNRTPNEVHGKRLSLKSEVPFGPYLVLGTLIVYLCHLTFLSVLTVWG